MSGFLSPRPPSLLRKEDNRPLSLSLSLPHSPLLPSLPLSLARSSVQSVSHSVSEGGREGGRANIMLRWMKKGNDVLLLQGKQEGGDRERGGEEEGWRRKRFVRFGASPPARSLDSGADCALGEMSPCTILRRRRRRPKYVAQTAGYTPPLRSYILSDAHNESNSCAVHSSLSKGGRKERRTEGGKQRDDDDDATSSRGGGRNSASEGSGAQWRILILHSI